MSRRGDNIHKRVDGRWEGRYPYYTENGVYKYKSIYGKSYSDVKRKLMCIKQNENKCINIIKSAAKTKNSDIQQDDVQEIPLFCTLMEQWLLRVKMTRKYSTYMRYLSIYECHIKENFCNVSISDITSHFVNERLSDIDDDKLISCGVRHSIFAIINQTLQYASEHYNCSVTKLMIRDKRNKRKNIEVINHTEQATLLFYLYTNMDISKAGIILCMSTGLRLGEICSLKWEDIDFEQMIIHVKRTVQRIAVKDEKTKTVLMETLPKSVFSQREIPISKTIKDLLLTLKKEGEEYVLCAHKPMEPRTYQNHFKKYLKESGIKNYNFHVLRHTFATNCIDHGMDVKSLSEILGHADVQITLNRYVHPSIETKRKHISILSAVYGQYCGQKKESVGI